MQTINQAATCIIFLWQITLEISFGFWCLDSSGQQVLRVKDLISSEAQVWVEKMCRNKMCQGVTELLCVRV